MHRAMKIAFCGIGALGSNAAVLCRNLEAELRLVDFDRVESKNLLTQAFTKPSIGRNKAEALKLQLANSYGVKSEAFGVRLEGTNIESVCGPADLLVDCLDNVAGRQLVSDFARRTGKPLVHAAISGDGTFGLVRWDERFAADPEDHAGQATCEGGENLPIIGLVAAALARIVQDYMRGRGRRDVMVGLEQVIVTARQ
jgi:molybdopterin-synthase adenylyltransferase